MKKKIVVLTGAGISAESGLRTFRDSDGLWEGYNVQDVCTPEGFKRDPEKVLNFYNMLRNTTRKARPNRAHEIIKELENKFEVIVVTQNIDNLHEKAGSLNVIHLHGNIFRMCSSLDLNRSYPVEEDIKLGDLAPDNTQLRPFVVWFGEPVPMIEKAAQAVEDADIFVIIGTSLQVYPAASLVQYVRQDAPKYIIDKKIPAIYNIPNLTPIEAPATLGTERLKKVLNDL